MCADAGEFACHCGAEGFEFVFAYESGVWVFERRDHATDGVFGERVVVGFFDVVADDLVADVDEQVEIVVDGVVASTKISENKEGGCNSSKHGKFDDEFMFVAHIQRRSLKEIAFLCHCRRLRPIVMGSGCVFMCLFGSSTHGKRKGSLAGIDIGEVR